jgi:hypothetical protein
MARDISCEDEISHKFDLLLLPKYGIMWYGIYVITSACLKIE